MFYFTIVNIVIKVVDFLFHTQMDVKQKKTNARGNIDMGRSSHEYMISAAAPPEYLALTAVSPQPASFRRVISPHAPPYQAGFKIIQTHKLIGPSVSLCWRKHTAITWGE